MCITFCIETLDLTDAHYILVRRAGLEPVKAIYEPNSPLINTEIISIGKVLSLEFLEESLAYVQKALLPWSYRRAQSQSAPHAKEPSYLKSKPLFLDEFGVLCYKICFTIFITKLLIIITIHNRSTFIPKKTSCMFE